VHFGSNPLNVIYHFSQNFFIISIAVVKARNVYHIDVAFLIEPSLRVIGHILCLRVCLVHFCNSSKCIPLRVLDCLLRLNQDTFLVFLLVILINFNIFFAFILLRNLSFNFNLFCPCGHLGFDIFFDFFYSVVDSLCHEPAVIIGLDHFLLK